jgi:hypothetical protein
LNQNHHGVGKPHSRSLSRGDILTIIRCQPQHDPARSSSKQTTPETASCMSILSSGQSSSKTANFSSSAQLTRCTIRMYSSSPAEMSTRLILLWPMHWHKRFRLLAKGRHTCFSKHKLVLQGNTQHSNAQPLVFVTSGNRDPANKQTISPNRIS